MFQAENSKFQEILSGELIDENSWLSSYGPWHGDGTSCSLASVHDMGEEREGGRTGGTEGGRTDRTERRVK